MKPQSRFDRLTTLMANHPEGLTTGQVVAALNLIPGSASGLLSRARDYGYLVVDRVEIDARGSRRNVWRTAPPRSEAFLQRVAVAGNIEMR